MCLNHIELPWPKTENSDITISSYHSMELLKCYFPKRKTVFWYNIIEFEND